MERYSLLNLIKSYIDNKELIHAKLSNKSIECYSTDDNDNDKKNAKILGFAFAEFMLILLFSLILFIYALILLITNWNKLQDWAKVLGILGLILFVGPFGPVLTIIVVFLGKTNI